MRADLKFPWPARRDGRPLCIAHRGASAHAQEGTVAAYEFAADLGSDMWELDIWLTADRQPVVSHDPTFADEGGPVAIAAFTAAELARRCPEMPTLAQIVAMARARGQALYLDLKGEGAGAACMEVLHALDFAQAVLGAFDDGEARALVENGCPWPVAVLVRLGEDPFRRAEATGADIIHLCWEHGDARPQNLVTAGLLAQAQARDIGIVIWHEERPEVLAALVTLPVLGICTDQPELLGGFDSLPPTGIEVVCHRGVNHIAPENTMAAARLTYDMGCDWLELDVRESADGEIIVIHDPTLDRTTSGTGAVAKADLAALRLLDAGGWKARHWRGETIPTLAHAIGYCQSRGRRMYIENKSVDARKLLDLVRGMDFLDRCFFWSPSPELLRETRRIAPDANIKANIPHFSSFKTMMETLAPQICEITVADWEREAPLCRAHGVRPMLKYFGDDPRVFARIVDWRPEMINLDRADLLLFALKAAT